MQKMSVHVVHKRLIFGLLILVFILLGCTKENKVSPPKEDVDSIKEEPREEMKAKLPIPVKSGDFNTVSGWLNGDTIVYVTDSNDGSDVYSYQLSSGEQQLLFDSDAPIVSVLISPSKEYLLIHSSPSSNEARLTVLTNTGREIFTDRLPSSELNLEWNLFNENLVLVSTFTEDWNFSVWQLDIEKGNKSKVHLPQPFGIWIDRDKLLYLDWDLDAPTLTAQLKQFDIVTGESQDYLKDIYQVDSFGDFFMVVAPKPTNDQEAIYTFYTKKLEEVRSFETPHLTRYSGWLVPHYTYIEATAQFLTYQPLSSTEADIYHEGFQLVSYDLKTGERNVIFEGMENEPLSCSPDGQFCLSGYFFEKLIDMESKEIIQVVTEEPLE